MQRQVATLVSAAALAVPTTNGIAASITSPPRKKTVVTWKTVTGPLVAVDRWGYLQISLVIRKKTTTVGTTKYVGRRITAVRLPVYPNTGAAHTIGLNRKVLPVLVQQVFAGQLKTKIQVISEATDTSLAFDQSLQAALVKARRV
jgi:uncharacterized protein with FMN-binding domain